MKKLKRISFLFLIILISTSFISKDLDEYDKWLKFYGLKDEGFKQIGVEGKIEPDWKEYDLSDEGKKLYDFLYFYSPDSAYFLDLDSYNVILDKDSSGNLTWMGGDPESKVQLVRTKDSFATMLLFFGTEGFPETAFWKNKSLFEIYGFTTDKNRMFVPTIWKYDLDKKTYKLFENKKTFKTIPKSYLVDIRLKGIKER